jgi:hypothetical protein
MPYHRDDRGVRGSMYCRYLAFLFWTQILKNVFLMLGFITEIFIF